MPSFADLAAANPNLRQQFDDWCARQKKANASRTDYAAFRSYLLSIGAPDPGVRPVDDWPSHELDDDDDDPPFGTAWT